MSRFGQRVRLLQDSSAKQVMSWFGRDFSALPVLTDLRIWIDASDSSTITSSSGRVSAIANKAPGFTSFVYSNGTAGSQPLIVANAQNGRQALQFLNSRSDMLRNTTSSPMAGASALTMFLAHRTTSTDNGYKFSIGSDTSTFSAPLWFQLSQRNYYETGSGGSSVTGGLTVTNTANIQYHQHVANSINNLRTYINTAMSENITGTAGNLSVGGPTSPISSIGRGYGDSAPPDMFIYEILLYNRNLTTGEISANISYLNAKWAI